MIRTAMRFVFRRPRTTVTLALLVVMLALTGDPVAAEELSTSGSGDLIGDVGP